MSNLLGKMLLVFAAAGFLAGCDTNADITSPPVAVAYSKNFDQTRLKAGAPIAVRTFLPREEGSSEEPVEVKGASCELKSQEMHASFITPALVELPSFKGKPSIMHISCKAGDKAGAGNFNPGKPQTIFVGDPVSMVIANLASAAVTAASNRWAYVGPNTTYLGVVLK